MPHDKQIRLSSAAAALLWPSAIVLVVIDLLTHHELGELGILVCTAAAVLQIRGFFHTQAQREYNAFLIGQDAARFRVAQHD